ncbi:MAG TPA: SUMF1/EgtB/PvdO family nonheme iron enzyme [Polyangiaceae bacterium]|jgi:sulfatase modifying factor 1|nr:SUMF1/EgtB/PvdO family nonheme iron enzyme [Polyangiaceae bacterium]
MRRGRALMVFGSVLAALAVATVSVRSQAANPPDSASRQFRMASAHARTLQLLPLQAKRDALFGNFLKPQATPEVLPADEACAPDMAEVEGDYCPVVEQKCLRWLDPDTKLQCAEFAKTGTEACAAKTQHKHFCIDRYEWPNRAGALPTFMASWYDAKASCEAAGKRLCGDTEWTLACEGPEKQPYPYGTGYERDDAACNIDKPYIWPHPERVYDPATQRNELARLDQREPSGSRAACVSPYGVRDMVGNVDEWVVNVSQAGQPHMSGLKGGYWGPVRTRCRPMTTAHDESFRYYQIGFRCCGDAHANEIGEAPLAME